MPTPQLIAAQAPNMQRPRRLRHVARELLIEVAPISPMQTNLEVFNRFDQQPSLVGLPVVEDGRPIGLINRTIFMDSFARPFHRELYSSKSSIAFMDKQPLVADADTSLQDLSFQAIAGGGKTLSDGFIVADNGRYLGIGMGRDLVRAIAELQAEKNRIVMESIDYASVIQRSFLRPSREALRALLPDHLLLWEPRDLVGGDYFYCRRFDDGFFLALIDCTGHGVPGAFMTLIMASFIDSALNPANRTDPAQVMGEVNRRVKTALGQIDHSHGETQTQTDGEHHSDDGMDAAFCWIENVDRRLVFAGAHIPLILAEPGQEIRMMDGDRAGVGYAVTPMEQSWTNHAFELPAGTAVYLTTDGMLDQPGGTKRIAFGKKRLCALLNEQREAAMVAQRPVLQEALERYQGDEPRRDDVSVIGFRI